MVIQNKLMIKKQGKKQYGHEKQDEQQKQAINKQNQSRIKQKKSSQPEPSQQIVFGSQPISMKCPFCLNRTKTQVVMKPQLISVMLGLVIFSIIPNVAIVIIIVILLQLTATRKHRCSLCEREIGSDGKFLVIFTDRVYSFSLGQNGVLISKKILFTIGLFLLAFSILFIRNTIEQSYEWTTLSWPELLQKCPVSNKSPKCNYENLDKTVKNWKGYVMRVEDRRDSMRRFYDYAIEIYLKMDPSQVDDKTPDLYLTGSTSKIYQVFKVIDELQHGDQVVFNATFAAPKGLPQQIVNRHLHIVHLNKTGQRNQKINLYLSPKQIKYFEEKVEGKALRKEAN